jgi:hypothetical protein
LPKQSVLVLVKDKVNSNLGDNQTIMSEFAFFRFMSNNMLTKEEELHKDEIMRLTEDVLDAKGIECDASISKISEEDLREILELVRKNRKKKKNKENLEEASSSEGAEEELQYIH